MLLLLKIFFKGKEFFRARISRKSLLRGFEIGTVAERSPGRKRYGNRIGRRFTKPAAIRFANFYDRSTPLVNGKCRCVRISRVDRMQDFANVPNVALRYVECSTNARQW